MTDQLDRLTSALGDRYAIEQELGAGGMATVYLAEDLKHKRKVAVKVLRPELAAVLGAERFLREIEIAAGLRHPSILPLYDSGEADGFLYYVMPYEKGQALRDRLDGSRGLPIPEVVTLLREILDALAEAHAAGVVHRDIKPDNIMLSGRHALVTDFGIAKAVSRAGSDQLTTAGMAMGTPAYMAPEQASGDTNIDHRADIYAVGAMAYEMITGRPPFTGPTMQAVLAAHITEQPESMAKHRDTVPPPLEAAVMKCLAKHPADRWQSARELDEALAGLNPDPVTGIGAPAVRPARTHLVAVAVGVVAVMVAVVLLRPNGQVVDPSADRVAVFPFAVRTATAELAYLGEGVAEMMATALDGTGDLRAIDPATVFRQAASVAEGVDITRGQSLAADLGAGRFVLGGITDIGAGDIQLRASLYRSGATDPILVEQTGPASQPLVLVRAVTARLLAAAVGRTIADTDDLLSTDSVEALKAYVSGATFYREGQWTDAISEFQRAVRVDPEFAMAHHKLSMAAGWAEQRQLSAEAGREAMRHSGRLTDRQRRVLALADAYHRGDPVETERIAGPLLETYPDENEAWYILGESRVHLSHLVGLPLAEGWGPLQRVAAGDPSRSDVWLHLFHIALQTRDIDQIRGLTARRGRSRYYEILVDALSARDTAILDSLRPGPGANMDPILQHIEIAMWWEDVEEGLRRAELLAADRRGPGTMVGKRFYALLASSAGRPGAALQALDDVEPRLANYTLPVRGLLALDAFPAWPDSAVLAVRQDLHAWDAAPMPGCEVATPVLCLREESYPVLRHFLLGSLSMRLGDSTAALQYADSLDAFDGDGNAAVIASEKATTIRALVAEAAGDPREALRLIDQFVPGRTFAYARDSPFGARALENVILLRLLLATGEDEEALRRSGAQTPYYATWAQARSRLEFGEAYERLGRDSEAIAQYDRFLELWANADEELQPLSDDVRGRISRLLAETNKD